jgi:ubiquinone/menaquinone biosynthesis C-methylase UbiE
VKSLSFDPMADIYDETRVVNEKCFSAVLDFIVERYPPSRYKKLFEPGIGTGRIGMALADRGYRVTGIDISEKMLDVLSEKLSRRKDSLPLVFQKADVTALPFKDASFDICVVVHLFHLVRDWQKAVSEVFRVLKPGAPLVLIATGAGLEVPAINVRYRELCAECGRPAKSIGLPGIPAFQEYLKKLDRKTEIIENRWKWTQKVYISDAFQHIKLRYYGMTRLVPKTIHSKVVKKLELELKNQYSTLDTVVEVPNQMRLMLVTT